MCTYKSKFYSGRLQKCVSRALYESTRPIVVRSMACCGGVATPFVIQLLYVGSLTPEHHVVFTH